MFSARPTLLSYTYLVLVAHRKEVELSLQDSGFLRVNFWKDHSSKIYAKLCCNLISDVVQAFKFMFVIHHNSCCPVDLDSCGSVKNLSVKWIYALSCSADQRNSYVSISFLKL